MTGRAEAFLRRLLPVPLLVGVLLWASFPPLDLGGVAHFGWALLFLSMRLRGGERAGRQGFVAGAVFFLATLVWIAPLVVPGWIFTALWCAAFEGLFARCLRPHLRAARDGGRPVWIVVAPCLHLLFDGIRTVLATGFPWALPGYAGWQNPVLLGAADLLGVHAATFAILLVGAAIAECVARAMEGRARPLRPLVPAAVVWAALAAWTQVKPPLADRAGPTVLLLQANIAQQLKEDRLRSGVAATGPDLFWERHEELAAEALAGAAAAGRRVDLVVWPETMVPAWAVRPFTVGQPMRALDLSDRDGRTGDAVARRLARIAGGRPTLAGVMSLSSPTEKYNTAILLDGDGDVLGHQDKQHLTPGGESLPLLEWMPFRARAEEALREMAGFLPDLRPGDGASLLVLPAGRPEGESAVAVGALVCYESIFPELSRSMVQAGADVLVNVSNYGWFSGTSQMEQALAIACFRAAELRRPMVLASNNGVSAVIGPDGVVRARSEADAAAGLVAEVPLGGGTTPFTVLGEAGAFAIGLLGAALALPAAVRRLARAGGTAGSAAASGRHVETS